MFQVEKNRTWSLGCGLGFYKTQVRKSIIGIQNSYSAINNPILKKKACCIAYLLSKSYQLEKMDFLGAYLVSQYHLIGLREEATLKKIYYHEIRKDLNKTTYLWNAG